MVLWEMEEIHEGARDGWAVVGYERQPDGAERRFVKFFSIHKRNVEKSLAARKAEVIDGDQ